MHFTTPDGCRIAYSDTGAGLPLLCLPGLTRTMADFDVLAPHLPPCRLIRMDYRGRGGSGWTGPATYTVAQEANDALALLDHLGVARATILGTSRGGLIGMRIAATAKHRLIGLCLNDIGPVIERAGLDRIAGHIGCDSSYPTHAAMAEAMPALNPGFTDVPLARWLEEARRLYRQTPQGLRIPYDPALREAFAANLATPTTDLWPMFDACEGLPLALILGTNSDLLSPATAAEMRRRRPDMAFAPVPGRAHVPFLDEPESLRLIRAFLDACT